MKLSIIWKLLVATIAFPNTFLAFIHALFTSFLRFLEARSALQTGHPFRTVVSANDLLDAKFVRAYFDAVPAFKGADKLLGSLSCGLEQRFFSSCKNLFVVTVCVTVRRAE